MTGSQLDPLYVAARRVLLDALDALVDHRDAIVLAGAQAVYVRTGAADLDASVSPYTTDADLAIDPRNLGPDPRLEDAMRAAGFHPFRPNGRTEPGIWTMTAIVNDAEVQIPVDLLVPDALIVAGGRRSARLPHHDANAARRTPGLEAAIVDCGPVTITSLEPQADARRTTIGVAGTGGLLVAKAFKINDRLREAERRRNIRLKPKDAGDVIRLMGAEPAEEIGIRLAHIAADPMAGATVREGLRLLGEQFGRLRAPGVDLAVQAFATAMPEETVRAVATGYTQALVSAYEQALA